MSSRPLLVPALLALGLASLASVPQAAHAQTAQVAQKPVLTTLHRFDYMYGALPTSALVLGADGSLYGTTPSGGSTGHGVVYRMTTQGRFTTLFDFNGKNGSTSYAGLTPGSDGSLYGATYSGGQNGKGTIYRIGADGNLTTLYSFTGDVSQSPLSAPILGIDGALYGTAYTGSHNSGTVYRLATDGTFSVMHTFTGPDGSQPGQGSLTQGPDGSLYGTTRNNGRYGQGSVYKITPSGQFTTLHFFSGNDGDFPDAALVLGSDGSLYGTTFESQIDKTSGGTVFQITPAGRFLTLHRFTNDGHGSEPIGGLTPGADGNFYGTTCDFYSTTDKGTIYRVTPAGIVTTLYKFHTDFDGNTPYGGVISGPDGALYGTARYGGTNNDGTIYKLTLPQ